MGKRVLVADDSATIQRAFTMVFGGVPDVSIVAARSYDDAMAAARDKRPDLVIADAALGARTGYELCQAIKGEATLRGVPVYVLASNHNPYDEARGRQAGADGHLVKPFESQALIDQVTEALTKGAAAGSAAPPARVADGETTPNAATNGATPGLSTTSEIELEAEVEDEYGEFTIERSGPNDLPVPARESPPPAAAAPPPREPPSGGLRPSLIPGARPAAAPPARPTAPVPAQPPVRVPQPALPPTPVAPIPPAAARPAAGRTMMGMPAVVPPGFSQPGAAGLGGAGVQARPSSPAMPTVPSSPAMPTVPSTPPRPVPAAPAAPPVPAAPAAPPAPAAPAAPLSAVPPSPAAPTTGAGPAPAGLRDAVASKVDQKIAALGVKGPEYEAIAKLSREVIEQVVWEVVPELAEIIIRQEVDRLANARK